MFFILAASSNAMNLTWYPGANGFVMMPWNQGGAPPANGATTGPPPADGAAAGSPPTTAAPASSAAPTTAAPAA